MASNKEPMVSTWNSVEDGPTLYRNSKNFREALATLIKRKEKKTTEADYTSGSWAYLQAHQNGYNQAIDEIKKLLGE